MLNKGLVQFENMDAWFNYFKGVKVDPEGLKSLNIIDRVRLVDEIIEYLRIEDAWVIDYLYNTSIENLAEVINKNLKQLVYSDLNKFFKELVEKMDKEFSYEENN